MPNTIYNTIYSINNGCTQTLAPRKFKKKEIKKRKENNHGSLVDV